MGQIRDAALGAAPTSTAALGDSLQLHGRARGSRSCTVLPALRKPGRRLSAAAAAANTDLQQAPESSRGSASKKESLLDPGHGRQREGLRRPQVSLRINFSGHGALVAATEGPALSRRDGYSPEAEHVRSGAPWLHHPQPSWPGEAPGTAVRALPLGLHTKRSQEEALTKPSPGAHPPCGNSLAFLSHRVWAGHAEGGD